MHKKINSLLVGGVISLLLLSSCASRKDVVYFQDAGRSNYFR